MLATEDDTLLPFSLPTLCKKKVTAAFDGGTTSSDGGVLLLAEADKHLGLIGMLAGLVPDSRDSALVTHAAAGDVNHVGGAVQRDREPHLKRLFGRSTMAYRIHDAATGLIEAGTLDVRELRRRQPWMADGGELNVP